MAVAAASALVVDVVGASGTGWGFRVTCVLMKYVHRSASGDVASPDSATVLQRLRWIKGSSRRISAARPLFEIRKTRSSSPRFVRFSQLAPVSSQEEVSIPRLL